MNQLFSALDIQGLHLPNRIVVPPMATEQADADGHPGPETAAWYGSLAASGAALVIVEHSAVAPEGRSSPRQISLATDGHTAGHAAIAKAIHAAGTLCAAQISHAGSNRREGMPGRCLAPSAVENPVSHLMPEEMSTMDIASVIRAFGAAARRVQEAGYDLVEVHCAHGYLLGEFLSPLTNHRADAYGGTPAARRRLLLEVVEEVKAAVHNGLPIMVRLGVSDNPPHAHLYDGALSLEEGVEAAHALDQAGVAILDVSAGMCGSRPPGISGEAYFKSFAAAVSSAVHTHVVCTGGITLPQTALDVIESGTADLVGIGRALAADHAWVSKAHEALHH